VAGKTQNALLWLAKPKMNCCGWQNPNCTAAACKTPNCTANTLNNLTAHPYHLQNPTVARLNAQMLKNALKCLKTPQGTSTGMTAKTQMRRSMIHFLCINRGYAHDAKPTTLPTASRVGFVAER
jgi:hypothetical protein